jgi:hypothetical protein
MIRASTLEIRDLEILRALLRCHYIPTRQINAAFFSCERDGRRRIQKLSDRDLVRPHRRGLPLKLGYSAWRLTARGVDAVAAAFPEEPIADGLLDRLTDGSLREVFHREALSELYLRLVAPSPPESGGDKIEACRAWSQCVRRRASRIIWRGDGDVVMRYQVFEKQYQIVPDATIESASEKLRIFIEMDRSTKALSRIEESIKRYGKYFEGVYGQVFKDDLAPVVLFVVRSKARAENIKALAQKMLTKPRNLRAYEATTARSALDKYVLAKVPWNLAPPNSSEPNQQAVLAKRAGDWMRGIIREIEHLDLTLHFSPAFLEDGRKCSDALAEVAHG